MYESFRDLIDRWPTLQELADDLGEKLWTVQKWKQRNSIPAAFWVDLLASAKRRKIKLNETTLVHLASRSKSAA